jgi:hypothetical protein
LEQRSILECNYLEQIKSLAPGALGHSKDYGKEERKRFKIPLGCARPHPTEVWCDFDSSRELLSHTPYKIFWAGNSVAYIPYLLFW